MTQMKNDNRSHDTLSIYTSPVLRTDKSSPKCKDHRLLIAFKRVFKLRSHSNLDHLV